MERSVYKRLDQFEQSHWWFCGRRQIIEAIIAENTVPGPRRLLEAGCGTGGNLSMLAEFGHVDAFEMDDEARIIASTKLATEVKYGLLPDRIPFDQGTYDVVGVFDVLEHVEMDVESLRQLVRLLAPSGRLIITVPALPWLWSDHDVSHHHFRRYTRESLEKCLDNAGLRPLKLGYFNTLLFPFIAAVRCLYKVMGIRTGGDDAMPPSMLNTVLSKVFGFERRLVGRLSLPIGISLFAVAERK